MDRELVERARDGDRAAFAAIATASLGGLDRLARMITRDPRSTRFVAVAGVREDLAHPTGENRSLRAQAVREANDRGYDQETQRSSELTQRR